MSHVSLTVTVPMMGKLALPLPVTGMASVLIWMGRVTFTLTLPSFAVSGSTVMLPNETSTPHWFADAFWQTDAEMLMPMMLVLKMFGMAGMVMPPAGRSVETRFCRFCWRN